MANVLVTGVAGFLGSHLAAHHLKKGDFVWGVDNFLSSNNTSEHYRTLLSNKNFMMCEMDICDEQLFLGVPLPNKFNLIYNFACPASPPIYQQFPVKTMMTCTLGVRRVLDIARRHGSTLVHASTSEVYGDPDITPQSEQYRGNVNPYGPRSCYDEGKRSAEALCYDYLHQYNTDARLVRIFNTYGPHMDPNDGRVVSNFICQALRGEPVTIYGDGAQTRSFCYVDDLIRAIVAMGALPENPRTPINIGNPDEFTVEELAWLVVEKIRSPQPLELSDLYMKHVSLPKDDPTQRKPNIALAREILKWEPRISLNEGLDKTIEYFKKLV